MIAEAPACKTKGGDGREFGVLARLTGVLAMLLVACCSAAAAGEIRREVVASAALGRDMSYVVYLPDDYTVARRRYPVLYLLHGAGGDENVWVEKGKIRELADRLIEQRAIPPAIIVMPGCSACWWIDGTKDKAETAFWSELVPQIARRYRTIERRSGMLVAGLSAGGFGAVRYALEYPERIAAVAALSPAVYNTVPPEASASRTQPPFMGADGKFSEQMWQEKNYPALFDGYVKQRVRTPFFLVSGDGDKLGIAFETALLFKRLFEVQPELSELRIVDGDHSWTVWGTAIEEALRYVFKFADRPEEAAETYTSAFAKRATTHSPQ